MTSTSVERARALLDQVDQAAGGRDEDVDAAAQGRICRPIGGAAVDREHPHAERLAERGERVVHLQGQLAGRDQDQAARAAGRAAVPPASRASIGRPKARVLPEPVWARPSTSRPASASGRVRAWMGTAC